MKTNLIILGAGGHATVLLDTLLKMPDVNIIGILDANPTLTGKKILDVPILGQDEKIFSYAPDSVQLVNGIGSVDIPVARKTVYQLFKSRGYSFYTVVHPTASIGQECELGEGVQIMAGCIVQPRTVIGANAIINTRVSLDHDCVIGAHTHIAPGAILSGNVHVAEDSHIGPGAVIIQGISVGKHSLVGAGAVVIHQIESYSRVAGVPAKGIATIRENFSDEELE
jgi:sugar O-acyltransferase (sialic acid O-acetyltransferase NeuD family)